MRCLRPEYTYEVWESDMEYFLTVWRDHTNQQYCSKTIERLSLCYKFILKIFIRDSQQNNLRIGVFFFFCNDKDIWSCIEAELQEVFRIK